MNITKSSLWSHLVPRCAPLLPADLPRTAWHLPQTRPHSMILLHSQRNQELGSESNECGLGKSANGANARLDPIDIALYQGTPSDQQ